MDYLQIPTGSPDLDKHLEHVWNVDWTSTPLGDLQTWPRELAIVMHLMMADPNPRLILLGKDSNMIYNPAYGVMAGEHHPRILGMPIKDAWPNHSETFAHINQEVHKTGRPHIQQQVPFTYRRNGVLEEVLLSWCTSPLKGHFGGFYVAINDVTEMKLAEKRRNLLKTMSQTWSLASDITDLWSKLSQSLACVPKEFPLALAYSASPPSQMDDFALDAEDVSRLVLKAVIGESFIRPHIDNVLDLKARNPNIFPGSFVRRAISSGEPQVVKVEDGLVPEAWIKSAKARGHCDDLTTIAICPIRSNRTAKFIGVLILGLSTRRPWNEAYYNWISEFGKEFNGSITSLLLAEESIRLQHESTAQAEREQVLLAQELMNRERETLHANDRTARLLKMVEGCDVGIFEYSTHGMLVHANDSWYRMSGHPRASELHTEFSFMDCVYEPDREAVLSAWKRTACGEPLTFEYRRWKPKPTGPGLEPPEDGQWVLSTCYPVMDANGTVMAINGCVTDIDSQKRLVRDVLRRAEALERARESERAANIANERYQRMTKLIELMDVGVFEYNTAGKLVQANDAYFVLSGIDREAAVNDSMAFVHAVHPDDLESALSKWGDLFSGQGSTFELRWKAPDKVAPGEPDPGRCVVAACMPILDEYGEVDTIFGCITDIDAQKGAENESLKRAEALERARASEHRFVRFTESAALPIYILDHPSRTITYCNQAWFDLTGFERTEYSALQWREIIHDDDMPIIDRLWFNVIEKQETVSVQFRLKRIWTGAKGEALSPIWVMATANPEFHENGTVKGIMGTMSDITGFKFAESVQQMRVDEAIEAKRQQENFIDMTSHEIRNPLGAVVHCADSITDSLSELKALTDTLRLTEDAEKLRQLADLVDSCSDAVSTITACSAHQKRIVDDILVLSKLDSNLLQIAPSSVHVVDMLRDVQRMFEAEAQRAEVNLMTEADPSLKALQIDYALLDSGRALQILINLVTNAIKFTKNRDTRLVTIRMGASRERPSERDLQVDFALSHSIRDSIYDMTDYADTSFYIWFSVRDTGRGMTPEEKAKIFSRFTQGSPRTYSEYGGSGLGLFISRELAGLQGGEVGVASEADKGSTFAFFIKTRHTEPPKSAPASLPALTKSQSTGGASQSVSDAISILVTEDNLLNQKVLKKQLTKHGYIVYTADNGQEALDFIKTTRHWRGQASSANNVDVDVVLMDIEMPIMNGLESASRIREYQKAGEIMSHIPIIAVSANARAEQTNQAIKAGMDDAIAKPFRIVDLVPKIDRLARWAKVGQGQDLMT